MKMKKTTRWISFLLLMIFLPVFAGAETVITSFYPVWLMTLNLTDGLDHIDVRNLAAPSVGCLHDYQLQPADMKALSRADLFLINGAGMETFLSVIGETFPSLPVVEASAGIPLLQENDALGLLEESPEDDASGASSEGETNSHIWLDPLRAVQMAENLAEGLIQTFPADEPVITRNLNSLTDRLRALNEELTAGLSQLPRKDIVTFHEAFPYFAAAYGLHVVAVVNREPGETLTSYQLGVLAEEIKKLGNPPLFVEPQYEDLSARVLAEETGSRVWSLDPIVTGPAENPPLDYYEQVMRSNMQTLIEALSD